MFSKLTTIAMLCTILFSIQAFAVESSNNSSSLSSNTASITSTSSGSSTKIGSIASQQSSSMISEISNDLNSSSFFRNSSSSDVNCKFAASIQNSKTLDKDKIECDNKDIESEKDDKSKELISKKEKNRYKICKKDEEKNRNNSRQNFETACKKKPKKIVHDLTDEDYNILFDNLDQVKDDNKTIAQNSSQVSKQLISTSSKTSYLDAIFGSIEASAAMTDGFMLPFAKGVKVKVEQDVHDGVSHGQGGAHTALDMTGGNNYGESIKATKSGTVIFTRAKSEPGFGNHVVVQMDEGGYAIYGHLSSITVSKDTKVNQGEEIGKMGNSGLNDPTATHLHLETISSLPSCKYTSTDQYNANQVSVNNCWTILPSIDLKLQFVECYSGIQSEMNTCGYWKVNNIWTYPNVPTFPNTYTSQNQSQPTITDNTINRVQPPANAWYKALDSGCSLNSIVVIKDRDNGDCQKLRFNSNAKTITNPYGQCLDASNSSKKLSFKSCDSSTNQKWYHEPGDGRIWSEKPEIGTNKMRCIEYSALNNGDEVYVVPCNTDSRQKWFNYDIGIQQAWVPAQQPVVTNSYSGKIWATSNGNFVFDVTGANPADGTAVKLWNSNGSIAQNFGYDNNTHEIKGINNKCLDAGDINNGNNRWIRIATCHGRSN